MPSTITPASELREQPQGLSNEAWLAQVRQAMSDRQDAMQAILRTAEDAGRNNLLASEQRSFDEHNDELRRLTVIHDANRVDRSQVIITGGQQRAAANEELPLLTRSDSFAEWVDRHEQVRTEDRSVRLGALLRTWVTGRRDGLNDAEIRAMAEGTASAGGHLVPTPTAASFIDRARNTARVMQAGATVVPMSSQTLKVPRLTGSSAPAWRNENASVAQGDLTLDAVTMTARSMAFLVTMSRELVEDSDPSIVSIVERDLAAQVALEWDRVALRGSGTAPEPRGVLNQTGVTLTSHGTNGSVIGSPPAAGTMGWEFLVQSAGVVRNNNFEPNAQILAPRTDTSLAQLRDTTNQYIAPPRYLDNIPRLSTKQVPTNLTVGTSTDCSEVYTGQWDQLYFGLRTGPMFITLVERYADVGQVALMVWMRGDIALAHGEAFVVDTGVRG